MTYRGRVKNGAVHFDEAPDLPDGTEVDVRPVRRPARSRDGRHRRPTLAERLASVIGKAEGLPPDFSVNLDHYLYGAPKHR
jgi:hypothetical protein